MKKSILQIALVAGTLVFSCQQKNEVAVTTTYEVVGEAEVVPGNYGNIVQADEIFSTAEMISSVEVEGEFVGKVSGEIKEVCTKKGCWFAMDLPNGESMRVTFKDYGFFLPTNSQGFPIVIEGVATLTETDVETLRHYAEDKGGTKEEIEAITAPERKITFEATGALVKPKV
ncbi:hypothetical protein GCM10009119_26840 [Algoriphagus jejuensis]|uniref:DUF4920 domain-containing protein n=1 Tax=Algoriphagus jejuensis TaxID=419934 RepID=A0ABP3YE65_9BACT